MSGIKLQKIEDNYPYDLLLQADETREGIEEYLFDSQVYVAWLPERGEPKGGECGWHDGHVRNDQDERWQGEPIGVMCLLRVDADTVELMNIAVNEPFRGRGIGGLMLEEAAQIAASQGYRQIIVGTGTEQCAPDQIRFYQRHGFRKSHLRANYFVEKYPEPIYENGVQLRDMQVLSRQISRP